MQIRQSSLVGNRPLCPRDRNHRVHSHGCYCRYAKADGQERVRIGRWVCVVCGGTISVLPDEMLPYRAVEADTVMKWFDAILAGRSPPPVTEKQRGCLARALGAFNQHIPSLTLALGQIVRAITPSAAQLWTLLRQGRNLGGILCFLAEDFKTSLTGHYGCLHPWPVRGCSAEIS
jgi:hypothetical protein